MSSPSEEPEERVVDSEAAPEGAERAEGGAGNSGPPPPPGAGVEVRGTVRVSDPPPPAEDGATEEEIEALDVEEEGSADEASARRGGEAESEAVDIEEEDAVADSVEEDDLEIEEVEEPDPEELGLEEVGADEEEGVIPPPVPPEEENGAAAGAGEEPKQAPPEPPKDVPPTRKRKKPWFETFFNDDYLRTVPPPTEKEVSRQVDFIERELGLERGATILDVGCGLGMHAVELASRGYLVVGLDLSLPMLSRAGDEAQDRGVKINFLHGDMRDMAFDGAFDAVLCWGTTFGYFDEEGNRQVIERLYNALKPRGLLLLDVVNRDFVIPKQPNLIWFEGDGCVCMEETTFNYFNSRLEVKRTVILDDGRQRETWYSIRVYSLHEIGKLLHQQGFRVAEISGAEATRGVFLGPASPRLIVLAERRPRMSSPPTGEVPAPSGGESMPPPPPTPEEEKAGAEEAPVDARASEDPPEPSGEDPGPEA
ncbi:MAG: SAM-dependent methyltransferase [Myxococcota bacterium]